MIDDEQIIRDLYWDVHSGDVVIDVGAHVGEYTVPALVAGADVIAIEPNEIFIDELMTNVESIVIPPSGNLWLRELALYDGTAYPLILEEAICLSVQRQMSPGEAVYSTLDKLVSDLQLSKLDRVKIDVEGGELGVLLGGIEALKMFKPSVLIEDHTLVYDIASIVAPWKEIVALLLDAGYSVQRRFHPCASGSDRHFIFAELAR